MPISDSERRFIDEVSLELPWGLVEEFATMPRWRPEDVNRGADVLVARLRKVGVPVEVHEPEICLSVPLSASVTAGNVTYRAKPPSSSLSVPDGRTGRLVALQANPAGAAQLQPRHQDTVRRQHQLGRGREAPGRRQHRGDAGLRQSGTGQPDRGMGRRRTDRGQPRRRYPLGHLHHDLGQSRPGGLPRASRGSRWSAVNNPDGQKLLALAAAGGEATIRTDMRRGLVHAEGAGGDRSAAPRSRKVRAGAWPLRFLGRRRRRQRHRRCDAAGAGARAVEAPRRSCGAR